MRTRRAAGLTLGGLPATVPAIVSPMHREGRDMPDHQPTLLVINPVLEERADDFERWLRSVVHPAMLEHQPEQVGRFRVLRAAEAEDGVVPFAFLFDGGEPTDWELQPLLVRALGVDGAGEALAEMTGMLQAEQYGWPVAPVPLDGRTAPG